MKIPLAIFLIFSSNIIFSQNPIADFQVNIDYKCGYATTEFINNSVNADTFLWDINGTGYYIETFEPRGSNIGIDKKWIVTLIAKQDGLSDTISKEVDVFNTKIKFEKTIADTNLYSPLSVDFINTSEIREGDTVTYSWDFGDGINSRQINPVHVYELPNTYYLTLTGTKSDGCELSFSDFVIVKDTAQKGEFEYVVCDCSNNTCDYSKNHLIERYTYIINELVERNDSIIFSGIMVQNCCTEKTATLRQKNDTIFIQTWEVGPQCTCVDDFYFEIALPQINKDTITISFNNDMVKTTLTDIKKHYYSSIIYVYPNPVIDLLNFELPIDFTGDCQYQIIDLQGKIIQNGLLKSQNQIKLNFTAKGQYFLCLHNKTKEKRIVTKFIKQ